jgi:hypothetical protein
MGYEDTEQIIPVDVEPEQTIPDEDVGMSLVVIDPDGELLLRDPIDGRELDGSATAEDLVMYRAHLAWIKRAVGDAQNECDRRLIRKMDTNALWTVHVGRISASAPSEGLAFAEVVDDAALFTALEALVAEGEITREAADAAIEVEPVTYKVKAKGLKALRRRPTIDAALAHCFTEAERDRRVTLKGA